jgi:predicted kinase
VKPKKERKLLILCGPPGCGKTTAANSLPGYLVLDPEPHLDALLAGERKYYPEAWGTARAMVQAGFRHALTTGANIALTIAGKTRAERQAWIDEAQAAGYSAEVRFLMPPAEECLRRCKADPSRPKTTRWKPIIEHWYRDYEPD